MWDRFWWLAGRHATTLIITGMVLAVGAGCVLVLIRVGWWG